MDFPFFFGVWVLSYMKYHKKGWFHHFELFVIKQRSNIENPTRSKEFWFQFCCDSILAILVFVFISQIRSRSAVCSTLFQYSSNRIGGLPATTIRLETVHQCFQIFGCFKLMAMFLTAFERTLKMCAVCKWPCNCKWLSFQKWFISQL